ncbi:MAG: isoprenylcysteine carboxylmethyltransferase family protein [Acidobacteria bacterium]|nr:isoprenylcysteine carboxylmethyltransferase family protein [Acidobacteriota bacterium]
MNAANLVMIFWVTFALVWLLTSVNTKRTEQRAPLPSRLVYGIPVCLGGYLLSNDNHLPWFRSLRLLPSNPAMDAVGLLLTAAGIALAIWARMYLGTNWSSAVSIKVGHELVRTGPYAWVRHPIYSGLLIALLGTAIERGKTIGLLAIVLFWLGFWIKSRMEERFMRNTFGQEYDAYSQATGGLIPRLRL